MRAAAVRIAAGAALALAAATAAARPADERIRLGLELKLHGRSSAEARFPSPFPFSPEMLPPGQTQAFLETVEAGDHLELSTVTLWLEADWGRRWAAEVKLDLVDLHDRNPTSDDRELDLDEAWLRWGEEAEPGDLPAAPGVYVKLGKLGRFERQDDRHLESYGLLATAFNRLEDVGLEAGADLTRRLYVKASFTQGNPLFFRDPNALAGDNGVDVFDGRTLRPVPERESGFPIFYDADVDRLDFEHPELGLGLGARLGGEGGWLGLEVLAWGSERELAREVDLGGTFYGGDLDLLLGPRNATPLPIRGRDKREVGLNAWLYAGGFSFFGQLVDQDLAGLGRKGFEAEAAWRLDLPYLGAWGGRQLLPWIAPAVRYSRLDNDFRTHPRYPAPSVMWDWEKIDVGLRLALVTGLDLTLEYADNTFVRAGRDESADELLATLRLRWLKRPSLQPP